MSRQRNHDKGRISGPFVPLLTSTLDSPAWRAMSHGARSLYTALKRRYNINGHNNGHLYLSQRKAAGELGSHHNQIARWFRELRHYGFIVMHSPGCLGVEGKGRAPTWRLTELGYMNERPTRDFERWDGIPFGVGKKTKPRAGKPAYPVPENQHTDVLESRPPNTKSVLEFPHKGDAVGRAESQHISSSTTP